MMIMIMMLTIMKMILIIVMMIMKMILLIVMMIMKIVDFDDPAAIFFRSTCITSLANSHHSFVS